MPVNRMLTDSLPRAVPSARWRIEDLPWALLDAPAVREQRDLFYLLVTASFIESGSDLYTRNLIDAYAADADMRDWLRDRWDPEEHQHGQALRAYVQRVWPEFDWDGSFQRFFADYAASCRRESLEPTLTRELAARCVVETGTTAYYRSLAATAPEPVLRTLANLIAADELNHYKHFLAYFKRCRQRVPVSRWAIAGVIARRVFEARDDDGGRAVRHVWEASQALDAGVDLGEINRRVQARLRAHLPVPLLIRMLLRPLRLSPALRAGLERPLIFLVGRFLLRT